MLRQKWSRGQVEARLANLRPCLIGMEACVGAHHLSRKLQTLGHDARLMPAKYVRPYSKGQKNDFRDAEAIAEAVPACSVRPKSGHSANVHVYEYKTGYGASLSLVQRHGRVALGCSRSCDGALAVERGEFGLGGLAGADGGAQSVQHRDAIIERLLGHREVAPRPLQVTPERIALDH
jgi:hypothetical protein